MGTPSSSASIDVLCACCKTAGSEARARIFLRHMSLHSITSATLLINEEPEIEMSKLDLHVQETLVQ